MASINRAPFNALVDDDGSATTGTIWNKSQIQGVLLDPVDTAIAALAKIETVTANRLLGRGNTTPGPVEEIILGANLSLSGTTLNAATGAQATVVPYRFSTTLTAPPLSGFIRFNAAAYSGVTKIWISINNQDGNDVYWGLMLTQIGSMLLIQDTTVHTTYGEFRTTADPVDLTTYIEFTVVYVAGGTALTNNETVLLRVGNPLTNQPPPTHHVTHEPGGNDAITALSASILTSGLLPDARLSANVQMKPIAAADLPAHATRHKSGGADPIKLDELAAPTDVTTLNASTIAHGLLQKLPGGTTTFLRGDGTFATPAGGAATVPGGATTQVQFNDAGVFAGDAGMTWDKTNDILFVAGAVRVNTAAGRTQVVLGGLPYNPVDYAGVWLSKDTPVTENFALLGGATATVVNAPTAAGLVEFRANNAQCSTIGVAGMWINAVAGSIAPTEPLRVSSSDHTTTLFTVSPTGHAVMAQGDLVFNVNGANVRRNVYDGYLTLCGGATAQDTRIHIIGPTFSSQPGYITAWLGSATAQFIVHNASSVAVFRAQGNGVMYGYGPLQLGGAGYIEFQAAPWLIQLNGDGGSLVLCGGVGKNTSSGAWMELVGVSRAAGLAGCIAFHMGNVSSADIKMFHGNDTQIYNWGYLGNAKIDTYAAGPHLQMTDQAGGGNYIEFQRTGYGIYGQIGNGGGMASGWDYFCVKALGVGLVLMSTTNVLYAAPIWNTGYGGSIGNVIVTSDGRLGRVTGLRSTNVTSARDVDEDRALRLRPVAFTRDGREGLGFLTDEVEVLDPRFVVDLGNGETHLDLGAIVATLTAVVQRLNTRIDWLESRMH